MSGSLRFWKMSGAGNDFIVADAREGLALDAGELARRLCPRRTSVGADGLLLVRSAGNGSVSVEYRNSDGSEAEFCGNGARCVARFARDLRGVEEDSFTLHFAGASVEAEVEGDEARVLLPLPDPPEELRLPALEGLELWSVRAGVPHVLAPLDGAPPDALDALEEQLGARAPEVLRDANVSTLRFAGPARVEIATLERGSLRTLACGSAAVAAASYARALRGGERWTIIPPSELPLVVTLSERGALLEGEARLVYRGDVDV